MSSISPREKGILRAIADLCIQRDTEVVQPGDLSPKLQDLQIPKDQLDDILGNLRKFGYVTLDRGVGKIILIHLTLNGFIYVAEVVSPGFGQLLKITPGTIKRRGLKGSQELASELQKPHRVLVFALKVLQAEGEIEISELFGGRIMVL